MWDNLFGSVNLLEKGVDATWLRNDVISNNIANAETAGFKASSVNFESVFAQALSQSSNASDVLVTTDEKHISGKAALAATDESHITTGGESDLDALKGQVYTAEDTSIRYDENNVDAENEMVNLAKNTIEYYALVSKMNSEFNKLNTAINVT